MTKFGDPSFIPEEITLRAKPFDCTAIFFLFLHYRYNVNYNMNFTPVTCISEKKERHRLSASIITANNVFWDDFSIFFVRSLFLSTRRYSI